MKTDIVTRLQFAAVNVQQAHWIANTIANDHRVLGELYEKLIDLTDRLAEVNAGRSGGILFEPASFSTSPDATHEELLRGLKLIVADARAQLAAGADDCLLNILADIDEAVYQAAYLLKATL
jgi:hypothetical protein